MVIRLAPDGTMTIVGHQDKDARLLAALGRVVEVKRGGHVVPSCRLRRIVFKALRRTFTGRSASVLAWTRTWPVTWRVEIVDGPVLEPFEDRAAAIAAEEAWLAARLAGGEA